MAAVRTGNGMDNLHNTDVRLIIMAAAMGRAAVCRLAK